MAFFRDLNLGFISGMNNWFMPTLPRFNYVIPNIFPVFRAPVYPVIQPLPNIWFNWLPRPVIMPIFQYRMPTPALKPRINTDFSFNYHTPRISTPPKPKASNPAPSTGSSRSSSSQSSITRSNTNSPSSGKKIDNSYSSLTKAQAERKASSDTNLERLSGGKNWSVADTFWTDSPYAKKGTGQILDRVSNMLGEKLVITSALGTGQKGNPHVRQGYKSHHNAENPKLDIRTNGNARQFAERLRATGYFSHVLPEGDHVDVQIDPSKFRQFSTLA